MGTVSKFLSVLDLYEKRKDEVPARVVTFANELKKYILDEGIGDENIWEIYEWINSKKFEVKHEKTITLYTLNSWKNVLSNGCVIVGWNDKEEENKNE